MGSVRDNAGKHVGFGGKSYSNEVVLEVSFADHFLDDEAFLAPRVVVAKRLLKPTGKERTGSPTQKPLAILERIVEAHCPPDGRVLDVFAGSGTTGVAAKRRGRNAVLVDVSAEAVAASRARLLATS